jgi:hypothetical protein
LHSLEQEDISAVEIGEFDDRFNAFWEKVCEGHPLIMVRDRAFLTWRFVECPNRRYATFAAEREGTLAGYVVVRTQDKGAYRLGHIIDFLVRRDDEETLGHLVATAMRRLKNRGVDIVSCTISPSARMPNRVLRRCGFLYGKPGDHVVNSYGSMRQDIREAKEWFVTRADSDVDFALGEDGEEVE